MCSLCAVLINRVPNKLLMSRGSILRQRMGTFSHSSRKVTELLSLLARALCGGRGVHGGLTFKSSILFNIQCWYWHTCGLSTLY